MDLKDILKLYYRTLEEKELTDNTIKGYVNTLTQLELYIYDNNYIIDKLTLIRYKRFLQSKKYAVGTINQKITLINTFLKWLIKNGYINVSYDELCLKHVKMQTKAHREFLTKREFNRLVKVIDKNEILLFVLVGANIMLRIGAITSIKKHHLNEKIFQLESKNKIINVSFPLWLKKALREEFKDKADDDILFNKSQQYYRAELKRYAGKAKIPLKKVYPHAMRHRGAKNFIEKTGDISTLQQLLAHSNISTTQIYTEMNIEDIAEYQRKNKLGLKK